MNGKNKIRIDVLSLGQREQYAKEVIQRTSKEMNTEYMTLKFSSLNHIKIYICTVFYIWHFSFTN